MGSHKVGSTTDCGTKLKLKSTSKSFEITSRQRVAEALAVVRELSTPMLSK